MIIVRAARLKYVFNMLKSILDKSELSKTIRFIVSDNVLTVVVNTDVRYTANIDILESLDQTNVDISILYRDISKLLDGKGKAKINIIENVGMQIETTKVTTFLETSLDIIDNVLSPKSNEHVVSGYTLSRGLRTLRSFPAYVNHYKQEVPILMSGNVMSLRYSNLYCQVPCIGISTVLDLECAKILLTFIQSEEVIYLSETEDSYIFRVDTDLLAIAKQKVTEVKDVNELIQPFKYICDIETSSVILRLKELVALTKDEISVQLYTNAVQLKAKLENTDITVRTRELDANSTLHDSFTIYGDELLNILTALGSTSKYYRKGSLIGFKVDDITLIASTARG